MKMKTNIGEALLRRSVGEAEVSSTQALPSVAASATTNATASAHAEPSNRRMSRIERDGHQTGLREIEDAVDLEHQGEGDREQHVVAAGRERGPKDLRDGCQVKHETRQAREEPVQTAGPAGGGIVVTSSQSMTACPWAAAVAVSGSRSALSVTSRCPSAPTCRPSPRRDRRASRRCGCQKRSRIRSTADRRSPVASISLRKFSPVGASPFLSIDVKIAATMYGASCRYWV